MIANKKGGSKAAHHVVEFFLFKHVLARGMP
jgi:hypothetical protein